MLKALNSLAAIYRLLGPDAILIPIPHGKKKPTKKQWQRTTLEGSRSTKWKAELRQGNIGVLLGARGNGIVTIDCDADAFANELLALNPQLATTLRTKGTRGCNFWLRCNGDFPRTVKKLVGVDGSPLGEWRADGGQTVIHGTHPSGCAYSIVHEAPIITVEFAEIRWPSCITSPPRAEPSLLPMPHRDTADTADSADSVESADASGVCVAGVLLDVIPFLPKTGGQNHHELWNLARAALDVEKSMARRLTGQELTGIFDDWLRKNQHLDPNQSRDEYFAEFMDACSHARIPLSQRTLDYAIAAAKAETLPPEASGYSDPRFRLLIAVCWQLQLITTPRPFFLTARDASAFLAVDAKTAHRWLSSFCEPRTGFLTKTKIGKMVTREANEYIFRRIATGQP